MNFYWYHDSKQGRKGKEILGFGKIGIIGCIVGFCLNAFLTKKGDKVFVGSTDIKLSRFVIVDYNCTVGLIIRIFFFF